MAAPKDYGGKITREEANDHFSQFTSIRESSMPALQQAFAQNPTQLRYYTGRPGANPLGEDIMFIFDKEAIQHILDLLNDGTAQGLAIVNGARTGEETVFEEDSSTESLTTGRPTLMVFPFSYVNSIDREASALTLDLNNGSEHPGTGTSTPTSPEAVQISLTNLPDTWEPGSIHKFRNQLHIS